MARIRVFLLTCRRSHLLPRALRSLLGQHLTDWTCELHNDAPDDDSPRAVLDAMAPGDSRIHYHRHDRNWGPVVTFNHAFAGGPEPYGSILEDDNWWEPSFLQRTLAALELHPAAALAWSNLRIWREEKDGRWIDTGRDVWRCASGLEHQIFERPVALQAVDALHSNGAMVFRKEASARARVPDDTPFDIIEPVRERLLSGDLVFVPEVLGNFAAGQTTARTADRSRWLQSQLLVTASFFLNARLPPAAAAGLWRVRRLLRPRATDGLLLAGLCGAAPRSWLRHSRPADWLHFLPRAARNLRVVGRGLRFREHHGSLWQTLRSQPRARVEAGSLAEKTLPLPAQ
jgi:Glycosyl transferase family 2